MFRQYQSPLNDVSSQHCAAVLIPSVSQFLKSLIISFLTILYAKDTYHISLIYIIRNFSLEFSHMSMILTSFCGMTALIGLSLLVLEYLHHNQLDTHTR